MQLRASKNIYGLNQEDTVNIGYKGLILSCTQYLRCLLDEGREYFWVFYSWFCQLLFAFYFDIYIYIYINIYVQQLLLSRAVAKTYIFLGLINRWFSRLIDSHQNFGTNYSKFSDITEKLPFSAVCILLNFQTRQIT